MKSRTQTYKDKRNKNRKVLVGTLALSIGIVSSINVAFADQDIEGLLKNWFEKEKTEAISTVEQAIMSEKEIQLKRIQDEVQLQIKNSEQEVVQYTEQEKKERVEAIRKHADALIAEMKIDNSSEKAKVESEMDKIAQEAINKMNGVEEPAVPVKEEEKPKAPETKEEATPVVEKPAEPSVAPAPIESEKPVEEAKPESPVSAPAETPAPVEAPQESGEGQ